MDIDRIDSVINGRFRAPDSSRAFTFIEFIKQFGGENTQESFVGLYKDYLTRWSAIKTEDIELTEKEYVRQKMVDILKSITLTYSSYEEQQYIASIDWSDIEHVKTLLPLYIRKIREICEFYRKKRNEIPLIVKKNSMKGSYQSIEQIIYEKIVDFVFNNRHLQPQMAELKQNLLISIEQYVDTYSEYFDIPRDKELRVEPDREWMIEANMTDVDYRNYIEINEVISEIIYAGEVYLEEIGLMAELALDLTQDCVGQMLELKNELISSATVNQIPLNEQINIKRRFYEKFLGCDLYYMYVDANKDIQIDLLCTAKNPSGNLLNCDTADRAVTQNEQLELLTHIGLFFKPDKTSILKINAREYSWSIDKEKVDEDTVYVFPDPSKYGDIGNNKDPDYPLIMEYKMDYDIRNISSGNMGDDPLILLDDQAWHSYYSKQQDIFKVIDNKNYDYSFTSLASKGFIHNYQTDVFGNEFALYKGYEEVWVDDGQGGKKLDHIEIPERYYPEREVPDDRDEHWDESRAYLFNGGYFEDPYYPGQIVTDAKGNKTYVPGRKFNHKKRLTINDYYHWTGWRFGTPPLVTPDILYPGLNFGEFGCTRRVKYIDHFMYTETKIDRLEGHEDIVTELLPEFESQLETEGTENDIPLVKVDRSFLDFEKEYGTLFIKNNTEYENKPVSLSNLLTWIPSQYTAKKVRNFLVKKECIIYETQDEYVFVPYVFEDGTFKDGLGLNELIVLTKKDLVTTDPLWNEKEQVFYFLFFNKCQSATHQCTLVPSFYKFNPAAYTLELVVTGWSFVPQFANDLLEIERDHYFPKDRFDAVQTKVKTYGTSVFFSAANNMENFNYAYQESTDFGKIIFSYNNNLDLYLIAYLITDNNGISYIYEHKFKLSSDEAFNNTLVSNVYSIIGGTTAKTEYNEKIDSGLVTPSGSSRFFIPLP